jgi:hypothetical protein
MLRHKACNLGLATRVLHRASIEAWPISGRGIGENIAKILGFWILSGIIERLCHIFA